MKRFLMSFFAFIISVSAFAPQANAQWTQEEGKSYGKIWSRFIVGSKGFDTEGELFDTERFSVISARIYGEYGISDRWTIIGAAEPFAFASYGDDAATAEKKAFVGPLLIGSRSAILTGPLKLAFEARLGYTPQEGEVNLAPSTEDFVFIPAVAGGHASFGLQLGYGFSSFWTSLSWGLGWWSAPEVDPASLGRVQFGWNGPAGVVLSVQSYYFKPITEVVVSNVAGAGQTEYISLGLGASWWFMEHLALAIGADTAPLAKSNAGTVAFTIGFEAK